jgi:hypothetical protein
VIVNGPKSCSLSLYQLKSNAYFPSFEISICREAILPTKTSSKRISLVPFWIDCKSYRFPSNVSHCTFDKLAKPSPFILIFNNSIVSSIRH